MKRAPHVTSLAALLLALAGCGINGHWMYHSSEPESARGKFKLAEVTFNSDGTYKASAEYGEQKQESSGTYTFEDGKLAFTPAEAGHPKRVYDAKVLCPGGRLKVTTAHEGTDIVTIMKRD